MIFILVFFFPSWWLYYTTYEYIFRRNRCWKLKMTESNCEKKVVWWGKGKTSKNRSKYFEDLSDFWISWSMQVTPLYFSYHALWFWTANYFFFFHLSLILQVECNTFFIIFSPTFVDYTSMYSLFCNMKIWKYEYNFHCYLNVYEEIFFSFCLLLLCDFFAVVLQNVAYTIVWFLNLT